jgi:copper resistance protein C
MDGCGLRSLVFGVALAAGLGLGSAVLVAHLSVVKSMPADESHVPVPPERVQVWFNQQPSPRISRLELRGPHAQVVELGTLDVHAADRSISAAVPAPLAPGEYELTWRAAGDDGHVMRGTITFTVVPAK